MFCGAQETLNGRIDKIIRGNGELTEQVARIAKAMTTEKGW